MVGLSENKKLSELVKLHIKVLGPYVAIFIAKEVPGIKVTDLGETQLLTGNFEEIYQTLLDKYVALGGVKPL